MNSHLIFTKVYVRNKQYSNKDKNERHHEDKIYKEMFKDMRAFDSRGQIAQTVPLKMTSENYTGVEQGNK